MTVSVGVAAADRALAGDAGEASGKDESAVVHHADRALYQAKIERNRVEVYAGA